MVSGACTERMRSALKFMLLTKRSISLLSFVPLDTDGVNAADSKAVEASRRRTKTRLRAAAVSCKVPAGSCGVVRMESIFILEGPSVGEGVTRPREGECAVSTATSAFVRIGVRGIHVAKAAIGLQVEILNASCGWGFRRA